MASEKYLVIVESPTKAKTIRKFLPKNYIVEASMGHVRDLPQSATDIPKKYKDEEWSKLGVNVENNFEPLYVVPKGKSKIVKELKSKMKDVKMIYLATDEDREGESISWHLLELLKPKVPVKRMVFHEITKKAISAALEDCRDIDDRLVKAQEARRVLDRLYGYTLSPLIWKKIAYGLSAGRVQSTGLRLIVEREFERIRFHSTNYWDIKAELAKDNQKFEARLTHFDGKRVASSRDFDSTTGKQKSNDILLMNQQLAEKVASQLSKTKWEVQSIEEKASKANPAPPFITSTLQQEGNRKLGMSAKDTMRTAQRLYENGLITYMRTDSTVLSTQAVTAARDEIQRLYGQEYLSDKPRQYASKSKGAQEAHEAIRPAGESFVHPDETGLTGKEKALYELIWKRTMATQMAEAQKSSMSIKIIADQAQFVATGTRIVFPGFLRAYVEGSDDPEAALENKEVLLPKMDKADQLKPINVLALSHDTKAPARFTEASIVQRLEKEGIGRPSTYATIIATIQDRGYVRKEGNSLVPTFTGIAVYQLLEQHFNELIDYNFTSEMESTLDSIAAGEVEAIQYLKEFYLGKNGLKVKVDERDKKIQPEVSRTILLPQLKNIIDIKVGRFGPYIIANEGAKKSEEVHASIPEDYNPADITAQQIKELIETAQMGPKPIGQHPESKENIYCLTGRYGAYVQLGEKTEENPKPRRASLPKEISPKEVDLDTAVHLLLLPRELGNHPETGKPIVANNGRFGPYVMHDGEFRSLKKDDNVYEVSLARAMEILSEEKKARRGSTIIKEFGDHPKKKKKISLQEGKYGMYLKMGTKNFGLPDEVKNDPKKVQALDLKQAAQIIDNYAKK